MSESTLPRCAAGVQHVASSSRFGNSYAPRPCSRRGKGTPLQHTEGGPAVYFCDQHRTMAQAGLIRRPSSDGMADCYTPCQRQAFQRTDRRGRRVSPPDASCWVPPGIAQARRAATLERWYARNADRLAPGDVAPHYYARPEPGPSFEAVDPWPDPGRPSKVEAAPGAARHLARRILDEGGSLASLAEALKVRKLPPLGAVAYVRAVSGRQAASQLVDELDLDESQAAEVLSDACPSWPRAHYG